jgi:hypothetical protein
LLDFVKTTAITFRFLAVAVNFGEDLHNEAGETNNSNGGGKHIYYLNRYIFCV